MQEISLAFECFQIKYWTNTKYWHPLEDKSFIDFNVFLLIFVHLVFGLLSVTLQNYNVLIQLKKKNAETVHVALT